MTARRRASRRPVWRALLLRPLNAVLLGSFVLGILVAAWQQQHLPAPAVPVVKVAASSIGTSGPPPLLLPPAAVAVPAPVPVVYDFRPAGRGLSIHPTPTRRETRLPEKLQQYEEAAVLAPVLPVPSLSSPPLPHGRERNRRPRIAIVIDDLGPDYQGSLAAVALPAPLTLAFLPYASRLSHLAARARAAGHELLVHMPMEPEDLAHNNPGPGAILLGQSAQEQRAALGAALESFGGYAGINNHMGSRFTADPAGMRLVLAEVERRGLFFLDSRTTPHSAGQDVARELGVRYVGRDIFLDNDIERTAILAQLRQTERVARARGQAVAIGHPHGETIAALQQWLPEAKKSGFELVPVSALARREKAAATALTRTAADSATSR